MSSSVFYRGVTPCDFVEPENPYPLENGEMIIDENGKSVFKVKPPVAPSMASDFDVISNSLRAKLLTIAPDRETIDPVDIPSRHPELFNF